MTDCQKCHGTGSYYDIVDDGGDDAAVGEVDCEECDGTGQI